mmetsp:Transcript_4584/g.8512  ORF Transcript_4584/g.8512 Transcript_4584/m.8512 type:complete len:359 (-) Transcript_4584:147-1223(-)
MSGKPIFPPRSFLADSSRNYTCGETVDTLETYINPCPSMMSCFYDEELGDTNDIPRCHCGSMARLSQEDWPVCQTLGSMSWFPLLLGAINIFITLSTVCWGAWIISKLRVLKQLSFNDITICLIFTMCASFFTCIHQVTEFSQCLMRDYDFEVTFRGTPGIAQTCLTGLGLFLVLADLKIPLLWLQIASSGMNKAEGAKRKKMVGKVVNGGAAFFFVTFLIIVVMFDTGLAGMYSLLWILILMAAFNIGSRKLRAQLVKPGEDPPKTVVDMMAYVRKFTLCEIAYIACVLLFFVNFGTYSSNPAGWQPWASLIYHFLGQVSLANVVYIRRTLDKKLAKFQKTGKVGASTTVSSASSTE